MRVAVVGVRGIRGPLYASLALAGEDATLLARGTSAVTPDLSEVRQSDKPHRARTVYCVP